MHVPPTGMLDAMHRDLGLDDRQIRARFAVEAATPVTRPSNFLEALVRPLNDEPEITDAEVLPWRSVGAAVVWR